MNTSVDVTQALVLWGMLGAVQAMATAAYLGEHRQRETSAEQLAVIAIGAFLLAPLVFLMWCIVGLYLLARVIGRGLRDWRRELLTRPEPPRDAVDLEAEREIEHLLGTAPNE